MYLYTGFHLQLKCHFDRRKHREYHVGSSYCYVLQCKEFKSLVLNFMQFVQMYTSGGYLIFVRVIDIYRGYYVAA